MDKAKKNSRMYFLIAVVLLIGAGIALDMYILHVGKELSQGILPDEASTFSGGDHR